MRRSFRGRRRQTPSCNQSATDGSWLETSTLNLMDEIAKGQRLSMRQASLSRSGDCVLGEESDMKQRLPTSPDVGEQWNESNYGLIFVCFTQGTCEGLRPRYVPRDAIDVTLTSSTAQIWLFQMLYQEQLFTYSKGSMKKEEKGLPEVTVQQLVLSSCEIREGGQ